MKSWPSCFFRFFSFTGPILTVWASSEPSAFFQYEPLTSSFLAMSFIVAAFPSFVSRVPRHQALELSSSRRSDAWDGRSKIFQKSEKKSCKPVGFFLVPWRKQGKTLQQN